MERKHDIIIHRQTQQSLAKLSEQPEARPQDLSVAGMLSSLHGVAATLLTELQIDDQPIAKRISMAKDMAKLIPLLATAERKVHKRWKNKDVEDMTDAELRLARRAIKGARRS